MKTAARKVAERLKQTSEVEVVSHIDADGISAAGIASSALDHLDISHTVRFVKKLDKTLIDDLRGNKVELIWFTDLGSGYTDIIGDLDCVITDHHTPPSNNSSNNGRRSKRKTLFDYSEADVSDNNILQVNPHLVGRDGSTDISGAGCTYLVAKELDRELMELSALAIVGAVGDLQDRNNRGLVGTNREILEDGKKAGVIDYFEDIRFFGRETRPLYKLIQYASEPHLEGLSGNYRVCMSFLMGLDLNLKHGEKWRAWSELDEEERETLISALTMYTDRTELLGEVYVLPREKPQTPLRDAKEFATLLNSCGRYEKAELGMEVCKGDRSEYLDLALGLQGSHRRNLVDAMLLIKEIGVESMENIRFVHAGDKIKDSIIGIVAGMVLGSRSISDDKPLFAFAEAEDGIKVSGRAVDQLVKKGLDLSQLMAEVTKEIGGIGGGHSVAAGATIPQGKEEDFLKLANKIVGRQLKD